MVRNTSLRLFIVCAGLVCASVAAAAPAAWETRVWDDFPVRLEVADVAALDALMAAAPVASFDREQLRPRPGGGLVWEPRVTAAEAAALSAAGARWTRLPDTEREGREAMERSWAARATAKSLAELTDYPTADEVGTLLAAMEAAHPTLARRFQWGTSEDGRPLWGIVVSADVDNSAPEPEVRLASTLHGNEPVGTVMLLNLAEHLAANHGQPGFENLTGLVDSTEIHLLPLYNPDGYVLGRRENLDWLDLNRNFPEPTSSHPTRAAETLAFMDHAAAHHFVVSTNAHTGALVVNYPWDHTFDLAPDDTAIRALSLVYAGLNPPMSASTTFPGGVTNGAEWYVTHGSVQDWSYHVTGCIDLTLELNGVKAPPASALPGLWDDNRDAYLALIRAARWGIRGVVTDAVSGDPLAATITVTGNDQPVTTDPDHGDYYKLLHTGTWTVTVAADGYRDHVATGVATTWGTETVLDVGLESATTPVPPAPVAAITAAPNPFNGGTTVRFVVPQAGTVQVAVYDVRGRRVRVLVDGPRSAGPDSVVWDGRGDGGRAVAAGVYLTRMRAPGATATAKVALVR